MSIFQFGTKDAPDRFETKDFAAREDSRRAARRAMAAADAQAEIDRRKATKAEVDALVASKLERMRDEKAIAQLVEQKIADVKAERGLAAAVAAGVIDPRTAARLSVQLRARRGE
jgi:MoxR-like ATPase